MKRQIFYWAVFLLLGGGAVYAVNHFSAAVVYPLVALTALWVTIGIWTDNFSSVHTKPFRQRFLAGLFRFAAIMCLALASYLSTLVWTTDLSGDIVLLPIFFAFIFIGAEFYFDMVKEYPEERTDP